MRIILQHDAFLSDFTIISLTETDPGALARIAPDILIVDPWPTLYPSESPAEAFAGLAATTMLIGYCHGITSIQARSLILAGFRGLIPKTLPSHDLARIIIAVICGGVYLHDSFSEKELQIVSVTDHRDDATDLSDREAEVLRHVALGSSMKEIANLLQISTKTVDTYKNRANQKLNLRSRSDIVRYAIQSGWMN
ncbi:response regulator transcription factor [Frigidibacter sp.]|uniref:helix-turn-helix transcriptional regulator n=1 Tax=Frigidibacter sp. TaxID=2586418 RepID=UPI002734F136|nr:response regulator transcription factor [Frigidibacter sp.]MDP3340496.1 response regulator transcription factor [Frigidibacter sp.]